MADKTKYYYLKIKEGFFDTEEMKLLESMDNGYLYSNILMKMYLLSLKNGGKLMFKDKIPYNSKMLSTILNHNVDILDKAIIVFKELNLIDVLDSGAIFMLDIQNFIGKSSDEADRKREYREKIKNEKENLLLEDKCLDKCQTNCSNIKDRDKDRDRDKDIDKDKEEKIKKENSKQFFKPKLEEVKEYCEERNNNIDAEAFINYYQAKGWMVGKSPMKDWKAAIRTWEKNNKQDEHKNPEWLNKDVKDYECSEEEKEELRELLKDFK